MRTTLAFALLIAATAAFSAPSFAREPASYQACSPPFSGPPFCQPPLSQVPPTSGADKQASTKAPAQAPRTATSSASAKK